MIIQTPHMVMSSDAHTSSTNENVVTSQIKVFSDVQTRVGTLYNIYWKLGHFVDGVE